MKPGLLLFLILFTLPLPAAERVVFVNVNVVPMTSERVLEGYDVFVSGDRIGWVVKHGMRGYPKDSLLVPGEGRYLVPGLAEMHSHLAGPQSHFRVEDVLALYVANGVTFARGMAGHATHIDIKKRVDAGELPGPRLLLGSPPMGGWNTTSVEDARAKVKQAADHGFVLVKLHEQLSPAVFDEILKAAKENDLRTGGHVADSVGANDAVRAGLGTIEHMDNFFEAGIDPGKLGEQADFFGLSSAQDFDRERFMAFARLLAESKTAVVPTFTLFQNLLDPNLSVEALSGREEMRFAPAEMLKQWQQSKTQTVNSDAWTTEKALHSLDERRWMLRELHRLGVPILNGADSPQIFNVPGFATHHELAAYVRAGLTPYQALQTATTAVGNYLDDENHGVIREGANADLVLVSGNPLTDIEHLRRPEIVMIRGEVYTPDRIRELLAAAERVID